jgi:dienelactone hydrolase
MPDYFKGDPIPALRDGFNMSTWGARHPASEINSIIEKTVTYARDTLKVKKIGAAGFCYGGPPTVRFLAAGKGVDAGYIAHPGAITKEEFKAIKGPLSIAAAGSFPVPNQSE